jgi:hypothetical protein
VLGALDFLKNMIIPKKDSDPGFIFDNNTPFRSKEEAVSYVKKKFEEMRELRRPFELQWTLNMNFLLNNQYCDINLATNDIKQLDKLYDWQEREVFNQIAPIYETRLAKLKRISPTPFIRPATHETKDISSSKVSTQVLKCIDNDQNMKTKRELATAWAEICGCCLVKDVWNKKAGRLIGELNGEKIYEGGNEKILVPAFEFFIDNNYANDVNELKRCIHAKAYGTDEIFEEFGVKVKGRDVDVFTLEQTSIGTGGLGYNATVYKYEKTIVKNSEVVIEYSELPCKKYPDGLSIIIAGNELLHYGPFTYRVGEDGKFELPFTKQDCVEIPGRFWGMSIIERLIPIQRAYNAVKNRKHELLNRKAIGVLAIEDDGNEDTEDLEEEGLYPGKILRYQRGTKPPNFLVSRDSAADFDNEEVKLEHLFEKISGVSPFASQSLPPSGVNSGIAMEKIREQDDTRISLTADNINKAAIRGYKISLRMCRQFAKGPRLLRYIGENNQVELVDWYASDLNSDDIIIEKEDNLSQTPAQKKQMVIDLLQYKLFSNDVDPKIRSKVIQMLELGNWEAADDIEELHVIRAKRENNIIMHGDIPQIADYDLHSLHIQEHNRLRLDMSYEEFAAKNPELAAAFDMHIKQHEAVEQQKMQAAMMAEQMHVQES